MFFDKAYSFERVMPPKLPGIICIFCFCFCFRSRQQQPRQQPPPPPPPPLPPPHQQQPKQQQPQPTATTTIPTPRAHPLSPAACHWAPAGKPLKVKEMAGRGRVRGVASSNHRRRRRRHEWTLRSVVASPWVGVPFAPAGPKSGVGPCAGELCLLKKMLDPSQLDLSFDRSSANIEVRVLCWPGSRVEGLGPPRSFQARPKAHLVYKP